MIDKYTASEIKQDENALAEVLREAGANVKGRVVTCPFCDDRNPSAGIYQPNGDGYRYKCHKCGFNGSIIDVIAKVDGVTTTEVFKRLKSNRRQQPVNQSKPKVYPDLDALKAAMPFPTEEVYKYCHPTTGKEEMLVLRLKKPDGKTCRQASPVPGGYVQKAPIKPWPLYNRKRLLIADTVVVVEGESCVHALHEYGVIATTSPGGAGKASHTDLTPLAGKNLVLWPDQDAAGRAHMQDVEKILQTLEPAPRIALIEPNDLDLTDKEDVVDFINQLKVIGTDNIPAAINEALGTAKTKGISAGVGNLIEDCISGKREAIRWPWSCIGGLSKALIPGTTTLLCGNVGASKSFVLLQAAAYWYNSGIKTAIFELEENREFHLQRCLAQVSKTAGITDPDWIRENPDIARQVVSENTVFLDSFGACVYASPDTQPTMEQVAKWIEQRAKAGCRVIAVDPITAAAATGKNVWESDSAFLRSIAKTATDYQCSIILITHPIKAISFPDVTQLQGGAAYQRFSQTILWLESHIEKTSQVKMSCGTTEAEYNRTLHILKTRNGKGQGVRLACNFEVGSLTLTEIGIIVRDK